MNGVRLLIDVIPGQSSGITNNSKVFESKSTVAPYRVVNIGNSKPEKLIDFIEAIEKEVGIEAKKNFIPMQAGDVHATWSDASLLEYLTGYKPRTELKDGIQQFVRWYKNYYNV